MTMQHPPVGTVLSGSRIFSQGDFDLFAKVSGDDNPIHVDPVFSAETRFGRTVAHGMLLYSSLRGLLDSHFPTATQVSQNLMFPAPTFTDEEMRLSAEITDYPDEHVCALKLKIERASDGTMTLEGSTLLALDGEA